MATIKGGISPGVRVREIDLSDHVSNEVSTITLLIGNSELHPAFQVDVVNTEREYVQKYGTPSKETLQTFFAASGYFTRGSQLVFTRICDRENSFCAAVAFDGNTDKDMLDENGDPVQTFPDIQNFDPYIYDTNPLRYDNPSGVVEKPAVQAFYTRHLYNKAVNPWGDWAADKQFDKYTIIEANGWLYESQSDDGSYTGTTEPTWASYQTVDATFTDGEITWKVLKEWTGWDLRTRYYVGEIVDTGGNGYHRVLTEGISGLTEPTWNTREGGATEDGTVVWEFISLADPSYAIVGGIKFKDDTIRAQPVYFDPEDTDTFKHEVIINGEEKQEDLVVTAIGPGEAYDDYSIMILGYDDAVQLKKYPYSATVPILKVKSDSPIPLAFQSLDPEVASFEDKRLMSELTYEELVNTVGILSELSDDLPQNPYQFSIYILATDETNNTYSTVEYFRVSTNPNEYDDNAQPLYVEDKINSGSDYIRVRFATTAENTKFTTHLPVPLKGGFLGVNKRTIDKLSGEVMVAGDIYRESDVEIDVIIDGDKPLPAKKALVQLAYDLNAEAIAVLDVPYSKKDATDIVEWTAEELLLGGTIGSYAALYHNRYKIYDKYNGVYRWVAGSGTIAGVYSQVDQDFFPWYAPAGIRRGTLSEILDIRENFRLPKRNLLYANRVNPVAIINSDITIYGQKTLLDRVSYLNRINVRRLLNFMKRRCRKLAEQFVFEFNDEFTRTQLSGIFNDFLQWIQNNRGLEEFLVVCDLTNNPAFVRENNEMYVDLYVKPTPVAEFVYLRFFVTRAGINLQELVSRTAG